MKAICYEIIKSPTSAGALQKYGYAYETDTHFIHFYSLGEGLYTILPDLTVCEKKSGNLQDWITKNFGAVNIQPMINDVGSSIKSVWRPGLFFQNEIFQALSCDEYEQRSSEQALWLLLENLSDLLIYIEPEMGNLDTYGHKTRELLILACTEVENQWLSILKKSNKIASGSRYSTNDYVKLNRAAFLDEYQVLFKNYRNIPYMQPFLGWQDTQPTQSLPWYDAYNKTKHSRDTAFSESKLIYVLNAVAANIVLHCIRFSPYGLYNNRTILSGLINQMIDISLVNCNIQSFYVSSIEPPDYSEGLWCCNSNEYIKKSWTPFNIVL